MNREPESRQTIILSLWHEFVGGFGGLQIENNLTCIRIDDKVLAFHRNSREASYVRDKLNSISLGKQIAILKTDLRNKPFIIRTVSQER